MTLPRARALIEAAKKATDGPWTCGSSGIVNSADGVEPSMEWMRNGDELWDGGPPINQRQIEDGQFIAISRNDAPAIAEALVEAVTRLDKLESAVLALIGESEGVYGLHKNGDPAPWEELMEGGHFEDWLLELTETRAFLAKMGIIYLTPETG